LLVVQDNFSMIVHQSVRNIFHGLSACRYSYHALVFILFTALPIFGQSLPAQSQPPQPGQLPRVEQPGVGGPGKTASGEDKYIFGVLPNYRTAEMSAVAHPLTAKQKLTIATKDSFAAPLVGIGAIYAGLYQLENSHPEFGQGVEGYAKRFGTSYCDQVLGNFMTEGIYPSLLKQDPRYFRMAEGSTKKRTIYAVTRIFVTRTDAGRTAVNLSELLGNATSAGIGLSYYPDNRNVPDYFLNWGTQLGTDAASQVLKEFWPDVKRWRYRRHHAEATAPMSEVPPSQRP
jgi:hypothetical protein